MSTSLFRIYKNLTHLKLLTLILTLFAVHNLSAQFTVCVDSGRVNPMFQCNDPFYNPVCGCNGITYRNQCSAFNQHGVMNWTSGVCAGIDVDFFPNPIGPNSTLTVNISFPEFVNGNVDVKIVDLYGKTWEQRIVNNFNRISLQLETNAMMTGIYFLVITSSNGFGAVRMMSKY